MNVKQVKTIVELKKQLEKDIRNIKLIHKEVDETLFELLNFKSPMVSATTHMENRRLDLENLIDSLENATTEIDRILRSVHNSEASILAEAIEPTTVDAFAVTIDSETVYIGCKHCGAMRTHTWKWVPVNDVTITCLVCEKHSTFQPSVELSRVFMKASKNQ